MNALETAAAGDWLLLRPQVLHWLLVALHEISHYHQHPISGANGITAAFVMPRVGELQ